MSLKVVSRVENLVVERAIMCSVGDEALIVLHDPAMNDISTLLEPNAAATAKAFPILSALLFLIAAAFVIYLLRCYLLEWRIERRVRRRVQRARAQYASLLLLLAPAQSHDHDSRTEDDPRAEAA